MKVFKFGGASVKDSNSIKNLAEVLKATGHQKTFLVVSAMGKTTNALEEVVRLYFEKGDFEAKITEIQDFHTSVTYELFENPLQIRQEILTAFEELNAFLDRNKSPNYDFVYDQVVGYGEMVSTKIISAYLASIDIRNTWLDVRDFIKTDDNYREGKVDWERTCENLNRLNPDDFYITQGFLGSDPNYFTTTLGREGSDYTAAIIAYCLNAESVTIWKDVPGVLNADPRYFDNTQLLNKISYEEAIELAYYGASVIHPKTMQPLRKKQIPFYVKSFLNPMEAGTEIRNGQPLEPFVPCSIVKKEQNLLTLTTLDFSFISEEKISELFNLLHLLKIKVNLMQNSAITLSLCVEDKFNQLEIFLERIRPMYEIELEKNVSLYTFRHFNSLLEEYPKGLELLRQIIKNTLQIIVKE